MDITQVLNAMESTCGIYVCCIVMLKDVPTLWVHGYLSFQGGEPFPV